MKLEVEHEMSEQYCPGNTPMRALPYPEVGHIMCTMCEPTSKLCQLCSNNLKIVAPNSVMKSIKNRTKNVAKAPEVPLTTMLNKKMK